MLKGIVYLYVDLISYYETQKLIVGLCDGFRLAVL